MHLCINLPTKWQTVIRMKYRLCSVGKGNTNNMMEKKWLCKILHVAGLLNSENPIQIQIQTETFIKHVLPATVRAIIRQRPCKARARPTQAWISFWIKVLRNIYYYLIRHAAVTDLNCVPAAPHYQKALDEINNNHKLVFSVPTPQSPNSGRRNRHRDIIWYNPPPFQQERGY